MDLPFRIPINLNALLEPSFDNYYVRHTFHIDEIPDKLMGIKFKCILTVVYSAI